MSWGLSCRCGFPEPGWNLCTRSVWCRQSAAHAPHCRAASCQRPSWQCAQVCFRARQALYSVSRVRVSQAPATCQGCSGSTRRTGAGTGRRQAAKDNVRVPERHRGPCHTSSNCTTRTIAPRGPTPCSRGDGGPEAPVDGQPSSQLASLSPSLPSVSCLYHRSHSSEKSKSKTLPQSSQPPSLLTRSSHTFPSDCLQLQERIMNAQASVRLGAQATGHHVSAEATVTSEHPTHLPSQDRTSDVSIWAADQVSKSSGA